MSRMSDGIQKDEREAADAVLELADLIQDCCHYCDGDGLAPGTIRELHKCYRAILPIVTFYHGSDTVLIDDPPNWPPSSGKFRAINQPKEKHCGTYPPPKQ